ncbi:MAG TPA: hypothetical protein VFZ04_19720, partial [Longimicrobiales bacterium]
NSRDESALRLEVDIIDSTAVVAARERDVFPNEPSRPPKAWRSFVTDSSCFTLELRVELQRVSCP